MRFRIFLSEDGIDLILLRFVILLFLSNSGIKIVILFAEIIKDKTLKFILLIYKAC